MMLHKLGALGLVIVLLFAVGCGKSRTPATVKVTGTVTYNGAPVQGASVGFLPESGRPASGTTDAEGRFTLSTFAKGDGAVPGQHKVTISEPAHQPPMPGTPEAENWKAPEPRFPPKYADPQTSGFAANVEKGAKNDFTFNMAD